MRKSTRIATKKKVVEEDTKLNVGVIPAVARRGEEPENNMVRQVSALVVL